MLFDRYIKNKRGKAAVFGLAIILVLSLFAEFIANDKPINLKYQGEYFFPIAKVYTDARFGGDFPTEANYKDELIRRNFEAEGFMVMPPIEFSYNTVDYELNAPFPAPPSARRWARSWEGALSRARRSCRTRKECRVPRSARRRPGVSCFFSWAALLSTNFHTYTILHF